MEETKFDFEQAVKELLAGKKISGKDEVLTPLVKELVETALEAEIKLLYLGIKNAQKKWTMPIRNWSLTLSQLAIFFEGRLDKYLEV